MASEGKKGFLFDSLIKQASRLRGKGLGRVPGAQYLYRLLLPKEDILKRIKVLDFEMWVDLRDIGDLTPALLSQGIYDPMMTKVVQDEVKEGMVCVDVGANIGYFTLIMAKQAESVWAWEPEYNNFGLLCKNASHNSVDNIQPVLGALSNKVGIDILYVSKGYSGSHSLRSNVAKGSKKAIQVDVGTLDSGLLKGKKVDFVKIDVQGAEMKVLEGMEETLKNNPDIVMIWEYLPKGLVKFGDSPMDFIGWFFRRNFRIWDIDEKQKKIIPMNPLSILDKYKGRRRSTNLLVKR